jgi:hypothetical protein
MDRLEKHFALKNVLLNGMGWQSTSVELVSLKPFLSGAFTGVRQTHCVIVARMFFSPRNCLTGNH